MRSRPTKAEALVRADDLAKGFVLLQIASPGAEEGWTWVLEGKDEPTLCKSRSNPVLMIVYDIELLHNFAHIFPTSPLTDFIDDYCRWFQLPLPEPEDVNTTTEAKQDKPKKSRWRKKPGQNARERRKTRRLAGKEGLLNEDLDQEERDELVAAMTVCTVHRDMLTRVETIGPASKVNLFPSGHDENSHPRRRLGQCHCLC